MIFDSLRQGSPAPEGSCHRQNDLSELKAGETAKSIAKSFRRKRMELRRVSSVSEENSDGDQFISSDTDISLKKKRSEEIRKKTNLIENALIVQLPENDVVGSREVTCLSHGTISVIGRRREMEDAVAVELGFLKRGEKRYDFFGVYDGHGGWRVAQSCGEMLHKMLRNVLEEESGGEVDWERVMAAGFKRMDEEVKKSGAAVATTGSTATVAVIGEEEVVVANCGDSRAVLWRSGCAVQLSEDHKPDRPDELERIEQIGGKVINWNGQRVLGVLATSRSIGDEYLKPFVISEPEVKVIKRTDADEFLILASDGLWDVVSNNVACQVVRRCLDGKIKRNSQLPIFQDNIPGGTPFDEIMNQSRAAEAAAVLAELAIARGSGDNISVIVVGLKSFGLGQIGKFTT
ncbi:Serine/threonine protein phosphatase [Handroanthus impetiginosus]|uniref:protein-serine/threonine phosphatase n=1 Tax=Handroanthus impetiginosus TaxID=429701 RepID=A0A2G9HSL4_9LAMI|nr:Serine/threonine protein phosphatase [Handroanthus impetiginosus]